MNTCLKRFCNVMLFLLISTQLLEAKVVLPSVFSDNMVLQQKSKVAVWGTAQAKKAIKITVSWNKVNYGTISDASGNWKVNFTTPEFGGPYTITISDGDITTLNNVLLGDVWICSGQSNMEMPLAGWGKVNQYEEEIVKADYPNIRLLQAEHITSNVPLNDAKVSNGGWQQCSPKYVAGFSSTAYFFAREVYLKTKIPIGLIHTSWGGTIAEAWTSAGTLEKISDFKSAVEEIRQAANTKTVVSYQEKLNKWLAMINLKDSGYVAGKAVWSSPDFQNWKVMTLPTMWEAAGMKGFDGIVWFSRKIHIPQNWKTEEIKLHLGPVDDNDITFINGTKVGETNGYAAERVYDIQSELLKEGENQITVRVFDTGGDGGIYGDRNEINLVNKNGDKISLAGEWHYKTGLDFKNADRMPAPVDGPNRATVLYNAMIHPYIQFGIKGAIWYQGESNADRAYQYQTLFPAMIKDWREKWGQGDFPFYFVQLANFMAAEPEPVPSAWAELREAQLKTTALPNTGMATIIDIGDAKDIHPKNKQDVGKRLACIALAKTYGQDIVYSGPLYLSHKVEGNKIALQFTQTQAGLKAADGNQLQGFAIAGADKMFYWAKAEIKGNEVIVSSEHVTNPVAVRYAWANNPVCNLVGNTGLPASPFRTDNWDGITRNNK